VNLADQIRVILGSSSRSKPTIGSGIFTVIEKAPSDEEKIKLLAIALTERDSVKKQPNLLKDTDILDKGKWELFSRRYFETVSSFVKSTYFSTSSIEEFSSEMFRFIYFFKEKEERIYVLSSVLFHAVMPYRKLPAKPLHLTNEVLSHLLTSNSERHDTIEYISKLPFDQYSEEVSMVLQVIDECGNNRSLRVALLTTYVLAKIQNTSNKNG